MFSDSGSRNSGLKDLLSLAGDVQNPCFHLEALKHIEESPVSRKISAAASLFGRATCAAVKHALREGRMLPIHTQESCSTLRFS